MLALQQLELAFSEESIDPVFGWLAPLQRRWIATELGRDVHQQLAVLRYEGLQQDAASSSWTDVLLIGWQRSERGKRLLEWLRVGCLGTRCFTCDGQATGLCSRHSHPERGWVLACDRHRTPPQDWQIRAFDLGLDPVPDLAHERAWMELQRVRPPAEDVPSLAAKLASAKSHLADLEAEIDARPVGEGIDISEVEELHGLRSTVDRLERDLEDEDLEAELGEVGHG